MGQINHLENYLSNPDLQCQEEGFKILSSQQNICLSDSLKQLMTNTNEKILMCLKFGFYDLVQGVKEVVISGDDWNRLPAYFLELKNLRVLRIQGTNNLDIIFALSFLRDFKKLKSIFISNVFLPNFNDLIPYLSDLKSLKYLGLIRNGLNSFPDLSKLRFLEGLVISNNEIKSLPKFIGELVNLTNLILWSNKIGVIPPELGNLKRLETLYLNDNNIQSIPDEIYSLRQLNDLDLSQNPISDSEKLRIQRMLPEIELTL